jgi:hypothetical protein
MDRFDERALSLVGRTFQIQGVQLHQLPIDEKYIKTLYLQEVRGLTPNGVVKYLEDSTDLKSKIGLQENINQSTIRRKEKYLEEEHPAQLDSIKRGAKRTAWNLFVQDIEVPSDVQRAHGIPEGDLNEIAVPESTRKNAIGKWVEYLLTVLDPLTFDQGSDKNVRKCIGLCAHCALQDIAPSGADDTIYYLYNDSEILSGKTVSEYIRRIERKKTDGGTSYPGELVNQFAECFDNFIDLVASMGFCRGKQQLAVDTTPIPTTTTVETSVTVGGSGAGRTPSTYGKRSFRFQYVSLVDAVGNFVISVEPYFIKNQKARRLDSQLNRAVKNQRLDIDLVTLDKEYYNKEVFKALRRHVDQNWVVCAKRKGDITQLIDDAKRGHTTENDHVEIGQPPLKPRVSAFAYPLSEGNIGSTEPTDRKLNSFDNDSSEATDGEPQWNPFTDKDPTNEFIAYVTDMDLTAVNKRKLHVCYRNRREIEPIIGQIRDTHLPYTESMDPAVRYYFMSLGTLFYNFHQLINRHPSPECGLPLEVTGKEWLSAIRNKTLSS